MSKATCTDALVVSAARHAYGLPELAAPDVRPRTSQATLALLGAVLTTAALGFVLIPAINEKPAPVQSCESALLSDGTVGCAVGVAPAVSGRTP